MTAQEEVPLFVAGRRDGALRLTTLPGREASGDLDHDGRDVTVREARAYRFVLDVPDDVARLEPEELFDFDDWTRKSGRLTPGEHVGIVIVQVRSSAGAIRQGRFDVRAAKFSDEQAFGRMLADLASLAVESLHQGFAPSSGSFGADVGAAPRLLYQQFAVLRSLLVGSDLSWAIAHVLGQPHRAWVSQWESSAPGRPLRGSSRLSTQLSRTGRRVPTPFGPLPSLPAQLLVERTDETADTVPNRFVKFVLERWRALASGILDNVDGLPGAAMRRGVDEATRVRDQLDEALGNPLFREVGRLSVFPGDNQVLRRREGYRQIAAASALVDGSLGLEVDLEDPVLVSRRSIATLYEYWTFTKLAHAVGAVLGTASSTGELFRPTKNGMSLTLSAKSSTRLRYEGYSGTARVEADLLFNDEFGARRSWTRPMRPDASLRIQVVGREQVWLHFDAKYRVDWQGRFDTGSALDEEDAERHGVSKRTDLLKMHAYKDAIRDSAGSYVLFPGSEPVGFEFDEPAATTEPEPLPSLGAFPLRPDHAELDTARLEQFLRCAVRHVVSSGTRRRRASYWAGEAYHGPGTTDTAATPPFGDLPPADTSVLLGYVRSDEQWTWIGHNNLYNVRADDRAGAVTADEPELDAALILCYGSRRSPRPPRLFVRRGGWRAASLDQMLALRYPHPRGEAYLIARVEPLVAPTWLRVVNVDELRRPGLPFGAPFTASWLDVVLSTASV